MTSLDLVADHEGIAEHSFQLSVGGAQVPGLLWRPSGRLVGRPTVLLGQGRTAHKRSPYVLAMAHRLVREGGWTAVALDAPGHGDRRPPDAGPGYDWPRPAADQAVPEWHACIEFLAGAGGLSAAALGYWGLSMGAGLASRSLPPSRRSGPRCWVSCPPTGPHRRSLRYWRVTNMSSGSPTPATEARS